MSGKLKRLKQAAGATFIFSLESAVMSKNEINFFRKTNPAGYVFFRRNIETLRSLKSIVSSLKKLSEFKTVMSIDEEGGRVKRLPQGDYSLPSAAKLSTMDEQSFEEKVLYLSEVLKNCGININFAPVVDLRSGNDNTIVGDRSFSSDPEVVVEKAKTFIRAARKAGIQSLIKHFPGHGATTIDSHEELPVIEKSLEVIYSEDMLPFIKLHKYVDFIMPAHLLCPKVDSLPVSMSRIWNRILRKDMGFSGISISDDIEMGALDNYSREDKNQLFRDSGYDIMTICSGRREVMESHWEDTLKFAEKNRDYMIYLENLRKRISTLFD
ncbi:MAG: beta-N-acetylhexosaminidase [bacterium]